EVARDLDQLSDIRHALGAIALRGHDDVKVRFADDVLEDFGSGGTIAHLNPWFENRINGGSRLGCCALQKVLERQARERRTQNGCAKQFVVRMKHQFQNRDEIRNLSLAVEVGSL